MKKLPSVFFNRYLLNAIVIIFCTEIVLGQDKSLTVYENLQVPTGNIKEFIKSETTYGFKVIEQAINNKTISYWLLLEKVGGYDLPNSSNYLLITKYPDANDYDDFSHNISVKPAIPISKKNDTNSLFTLNSQFFFHDVSWVQAAKAIPENDFKYFLMDYHNTNYPDSLIGLENQYWLPFLKNTMTMDSGQVSIVAWGNAKLLNPLSENIKFTTVSYDIFRNLQETLLPANNPKSISLPKQLSAIRNLELNRREYILYRVVKFAGAR